MMDDEGSYIPDDDVRELTPKEFYEEIRFRLENIKEGVAHYEVPQGANTTPALLITTVCNDLLGSIADDDPAAFDPVRLRGKLVELVVKLRAIEEQVSQEKTGWRAWTHYASTFVYHYPSQQVQKIIDETGNIIFSTPDAPPPLENVIARSEYDRLSAELERLRGEKTQLQSEMTTQLEALRREKAHLETQLAELNDVKAKKVAADVCLARLTESTVELRKQLEAAQKKTTDEQAKIARLQQDSSESSEQAKEAVNLAEAEAKRLQGLLGQAIKAKHAAAAEVESLQLTVGQKEREATDAKTKL